MQYLNQNKRVMEQGTSSGNEQCEEQGTSGGNEQHGEQPQTPAVQEEWHTPEACISIQQPEQQVPLRPSTRKTRPTLPFSGSASLSTTPYCERSWDPANAIHSPMFLPTIWPPLLYPLKYSILMPTSYESSLLRDREDSYSQLIVI